MVGGLSLDLLLTTTPSELHGSALYSNRNRPISKVEGKESA